MKGKTLVLVISLLLCSFYSISAIIYVDKTATGSNDGSDWANAYTNLQTAIDAANLGDELWVAAEHYYPSTTLRTVSFMMKEGVVIYGGFSGVETVLSQRDIVANETYLDGSGVSGGSYHIIKNDNNGLTSNAVLDGFTLFGGKADGAAIDGMGSAIYNKDVSPSIRNCKIVSNQTLTNGAIYMENSTSTISLCIFQSNQAIGVYNTSGLYATNSQLIIDACVFTTGGGLSLSSVNTIGISINNCSIINNSRSLGSSPEVVYINGTAASVVSISGSIFSGNQGGGNSYSNALKLNGAFSGLISDCDFLNNTSFNNTVEVNGGNTSTFQRCTFKNNTGSQGGAVNVTTASPIFENCLFTGNNANTIGGAVCNNIGSSSSFINCTFSENSATLAGGGLFNRTATSGGFNQVPALIKNCIFWCNSPDDIAGKYPVSILNSLIGLYPPSSTTSGGSWIGYFGNWKRDYKNWYTYGSGNIDADPQFVDVAGEDFHLLNCSPAINTGTNVGIITTLDLDSATRNISGTVDMGCYEYQLVQAIPPSSSINPSQLIASEDPTCVGSTITLTQVGGILGSGGAQWEWFKNGVLVYTGTEDTLVVTITASTDYFHIEASGGTCGTGDCGGMWWMPYIKIPASISASATTTCAGSNVTLTKLGGYIGTGDVWKWYSGSCGGTLLGTGNSIVVSPTDTTKYYLRGEGGTCNTACDSITINVKPASASTPPTSIIGSVDPVCQNGFTTLSLNGGVLAPGESWKWYQFGCGTLLKGTGDTISVQVSGTSTFYVRAEGANVCPSSCVSKTFVANTTSTSAASASASPSSICSGSSSTISLSGGFLGVGASWVWYADSCGGVSVGTGQSISVTPSNTTTYYGRAENACGNTICRNTTVTVTSSPVAPTSVTVAPDTICSGNSDTLTANGGSGTYKWYTQSGGCGNALVGTGQTIVVSPLVTTGYLVRTEQGSCYSACILGTVIVSNGNPVGTVTWNGSVNDNWNNCSNWTPNVIPTVASLVVIPNGNTIQPKIYAGDTGDCFTIQIDGNGLLTIDSDNGALLNVAAP